MWATESFCSGAKSYSSTASRSSNNDAMMKYANQCPKDMDLSKHPISCVCPTTQQERGSTTQHAFRPQYMSATSADPNALMRQFYQDQAAYTQSYASLAAAGKKPATAPGGERPGAHASAMPGSPIAKK